MIEKNHLFLAKLHAQRERLTPASVLPAALLEIDPGRWPLVASLQPRDDERRDALPPRAAAGASDTRFTHPHAAASDWAGLLC